MAGYLQRALRQRKPFPSLEAEAFLNLQRTADALMRALADLLKQWDLSPTQYNVLRILRGAGDQGLSCGEIAVRMVTRDPDITRLLDRLQRRRLIHRARARTDRRVVRARLAPDGLHIVNSLDGPTEACLVRLLGHLTRQQLHALIELLEAARRKVDTPSEAPVA